MAKLLLEDILECIQKINDYTKGMVFENFSQDEKTQDAVVRNLEIIGEAANNISKAFRKKYPNIEWHQIIGMRHRIIHDYFGVDENIIWFVVQNDLIPLKTEIEKILESELD
jgi:uncharacterized protein with HEPN domain